MLYFSFAPLCHCDTKYDGGLPDTKDDGDGDGGDDCDGDDGLPDTKALQKGSPA